MDTHIAAMVATRDLEKIGGGMVGVNEMYCKYSNEARPKRRCVSDVRLGLPMVWTRGRDGGDGGCLEGCR